MCLKAKKELKKDLEKVRKKFEKSLRKVLTNRNVCGILFELSERDSDWTLKIKQRDKKRNPRFF